MKLLSVVLLFCSLFALSCKKDNPIPPGEQPQINLTLEDVSCTEAWIKLSTSNLSLPAEVQLQKDGSLYRSINLISADTILYVDSLLPNKTYTFRSFSHSTIQPIKSAVTVSTLDTTSHNFTWQTFTFGGQAGSCMLYDCAIISPDDIWCVGRINIADTSINGYTTYNAVHWDGTRWELKRLRYYGNCSAVEFPPLKAIWASSDTSIFISNGGSIGRFDGYTVILDCGVNHLLSGAINKIWEVSEDNLYVVGNNGNIAHYQNDHWSKIESGTDADIRDIWGITDELTNKRKIFCAVPSSFDLTKRKILIINEDDSIDSLKWNGKIVTSTWTDKGRIFYASGDGIYYNKNNSWQKETSLPDSYTYRIRGNGLNDLFVCGNYGFLAHYNGISWYVYPEFLPIIASVFYSVSFKDNIVVAVGYDGDMAYIVMGIRN